MNRKLTTAILCVCGLSASPVMAGFFPQAGVDSAPSLARAVITFINPDFIESHPTMTNWEGIPMCSDPNDYFNCSDRRRTIISPVLYQGQTKVGRSKPFFHSDSGPDVNGASVCKAGLKSSCTDFYTDLVADSDFVHQMNQGPLNTQEVHTQMLSLNLKPLWPPYNPSQQYTSANRIRAGEAINPNPGNQLPLLLRSMGEVESLDHGSANSQGGFPAESFFNMMVEVDFDYDFDNTVDFTLFTKESPLLVVGTGLLDFPPKLVYQHNATENAPPVYDKANPNGDAVGYLRMAGHGMNYGTVDVLVRKRPRDGEAERKLSEDVNLFSEIFWSSPMLPIPSEVQLGSGVPCLLYAIQDHGRNDSQFFTIVPETLEVRPLSVRYPAHDLEGLATHPDSDMLYATSGNDTKQPGYLYRFDATVGKLIKIGDTSFGDVPSIAFDSKGVLWGWVKGKGLITIDVGTGKGTMVQEFPGVLVEDITWNNAGTHIYGSENTSLWIYEHATQTTRLACNNLPGETEALEMLPDGSLLLGIHGEEKILQFQAINVETCEIVFGVDIPTSPTVNDVEGIAWPIKACSQP